jgi:hypothetical protein
LNLRSLFHLAIIFIICSVVLILRHAGIHGPNSDTAIFPLTALHLMQGKPFPFFFYGQDYMGTLPVLFILLSFKTLGVSYILVELFYALVIAGIVTLFSAFLLREISFFGVTIFVGTFLLFPHGDAVSIIGLKNGIHLSSIFLGLLSGGLFCWYVNKTIGENEDKALLSLFFPLCIFIILSGLTYWSSKLGFLYLTAIFLTGLLGCRKILIRILSGYYFRTKNLIPSHFRSFFIYFKVHFKFMTLIMVILASIYFIQLYPEKKILQPEDILALKSTSNDTFQNKIQKRLASPEIQIASKIDIHESGLINFFTLAKKGFQRIKRNIFHVCKLYLYLFSNIIQPLNFIWALLPLLFGGYFFFSKRIEFISLLKGNWTKIKFKWVMISLPFFNILASLPSNYLITGDLSSIRYFLSLNLVVLAVIPLFFFLIQSTKLRNISLTLYLLFAVCSYVYSDPKHYNELIKIPSKIKFIKSRYSDQSRLLPSEKDLLKFLEDEKLYFGYANYWDAYRLTFLTHERFIISPRHGQRLRYKPYEQLVKNSKNPFYIFSLHYGDDQKAIKKLNTMESESFRQKTFGHMVLFY